MKIVSYNCNSIRNNAEIVKSLFNDADIILLQELMLEKRDLIWYKALVKPLNVAERFKHNIHNLSLKLNIASLRPK